MSRKKSSNDKENISNSKSSSADRIRQYTERSDGEAVGPSFQQIEVSSAAGNVVETRNIALSPFDMKKVKEALAADTPQVVFINATEVESILDQFEELLLTMEIEEELLRRDLELAKLLDVSSTAPPSPRIHNNDNDESPKDSSENNGEDLGDAKPRDQTDHKK